MVIADTIYESLNASVTFHFEMSLSVSLFHPRALKGHDFTPEMHLQMN